MDKKTLNISIKHILEKLNEEYEIFKEKGGGQIKHGHYIYNDDGEIIIPRHRWVTWANELNIDYARLNDVLDILKHRGFINKYRFISDYM